MKQLLKKTYVVGLAMVVFGLIEGFQTGDWESATRTILLGLGLISGRHAIAKLEM